MFGAAVSSKGLDEGRDEDRAGQPCVRGVCSVPTARTMRSKLLEWPAVTGRGSRSVCAETRGGGRLVPIIFSALIARSSLVSLPPPLLPTRLACTCIWNGALFHLFSCATCIISVLGKSFIWRRAA